MCLACFDKHNFLKFRFIWLNGNMREGIMGRNVWKEGYLFTLFFLNMLAIDL